MPALPAGCEAEPRDQWVTGQIPVTQLPNDGAAPPQPSPAEMFVPAAAETTPFGNDGPFAGDFEHEEVVVDRYAALEAASLWFERLPRETDSASGSDSAALTAPRLVEGTDEEDWPNRATVIRVLPPDDNDLIVVIEDERRSPRGETDGSPQRQEYRQLFSRLRQS